MSLFPAYASVEKCEETVSEPNESEKWLENQSFQIKTRTEKVDATADDVNTSDEQREQKKDKSRKRKKSKKHHRSPSPSPRKKAPTESNEQFTIDKHRTKEFLNVQTISRPSVSLYHIAYYLHCPNRGKKSKIKIKRYFHRKTSKPIENSDSNKASEEKDGSKTDTSLEQEQALSKKTGQFNRQLDENPDNIDSWLEYVNFQNDIYQFEKTYRKGSIAKGLRVLAERKLVILDRALNLNPNSDELQRKRLEVAAECYPADELQIYLKNLIDKDSGNIVLWQGYIESTQCSMSHCNTPAVIGLYTRCLLILHQLRRNSAIEKSVLEENILKMLYQCGLFLKQSGLFEQLWTLLRLYLELNLSPSNEKKFNISINCNDKLIELEEIVFSSQLPLHELWLRTEKLREACHWLPFAEEGGECEDPQRLVFPEDVAELIHPITMPENTFKLIATILTLLKVPLLPYRHTTMTELGLNYVPWALDSIETILPMFLTNYPIDLNNKYISIDPRLSVGPQYLNVLPGQEEYLDFLLATMKNCADCIRDCDKIATSLWWLRFQKMLIVLNRQERFKLPTNYPKKIRDNYKKFLKLEENRNNILYYCEYALLEFEMEKAESCFSVLQTALSFTSNNPIAASDDDENQTGRCHLYRTLIELNLKMDRNQSETLKLLIGYVLERDGNIENVTTDLIQQCSLKLKHISHQLVEKEESTAQKFKVTNHFLPNFTIDWIIIHGWFIYLTQSAIECGKYIETVLSEFSDRVEFNWHCEVLYEFYVCILFKYCTENANRGLFQLLNETLYRAIEKYPNNLFLLSVTAKEHSIFSCSGSSWWKLKSVLINTGHSFPTLLLLLIANQQIVEAQKSIVFSDSGEQFSINDCYKNRILALFKRITKPDMCTRRCGLVWRLYLQFVHAYFDPGLCRNVYYSAVEECPWLKSLYIDAAIYIPADLAKIQDLIIEKQLRLHVTPEELDVLRS